MLTKRELYEARRNYLASRGLCMVCGQAKAREGKSSCEACYEKKKEYQKKYMDKNREKVKEHQRKRYKEKKDKKICPRCRASVKYTRYVYCEECREILKLRSKGFD